MRVTQIELSNVIGLKQLEFEPGYITEIDGKNGKGKTSVADSIVALISGGRDAAARERQADMVNVGAEQGSATMTLESNGSQIVIKKTWPAGRLSVTRDGKRIAEPPQEYVDGLFDRLVNPLDFVNAKADQQQEWLLQAMPLKVTAEELFNCVDPKQDARQRMARFAGYAGQHALVAIDKVYDEEYEARRVANVTGKSKRETEAGLRETFPKPRGPELVVNLKSTASNRLSELLREEGALRSRLQTVHQTAAKMVEQEEQAAENAFNEAKGKIDAELAEEIRLARERHTTKLWGIREIHQNRVTQARVDRDTAVDAAKTELGNQLEGVVAAVATARAEAQEEQRIGSARLLADRMAADAEAQEIIAKEHDTALTKLDALKERLLASLPIAGLEYKSGKMFRAGVAIARLNTQQKIELGIDVAELRVGKVGLILVDGLERLDTEHYNAFLAKASQTGLQYLITRVSDDTELKIRRVA